MRPNHDPGIGNRGTSCGRGFTLIELLTACAILSLLTLVLVGIAGQGGRLWSQTESQSQARQRARAMLDFLAAELRQAVIPLEPSRQGLQFVVNPTGIGSEFLNRDAIFWQAPVVADSGSGDLAELGYFVRWNGTRASLCRVLVAPDNADYLVYDKPDDWLSDALLDRLAPADKANKYRGLFLENVIALWVEAFQADGTAYGGDSRLTNRLPATVKLTLVLLDSSTSARLADSSTVTGLYAGATSPEDLVSKLPPAIRPGCDLVSTVVNMANYR